MTKDERNLLANCQSVDAILYNVHGSDRIRTLAVALGAELGKEADDRQRQTNIEAVAELTEDTAHRTAVIRHEAA